jgi:hypothetical protein
MNILDIIKTNENVNSLYFTIARTNFLKNEEKGMLRVSADDAYEQYLQGIDTTYNLSIFYDTTTHTYNEDTQFVIQINNLEPTIIDKLTPQKTYYSRRNELQYMSCLECESECKVLSTFEKYYECTCCQKQQEVKYVIECTKCCTKYIYF